MPSRKEIKLQVIQKIAVVMHIPEEDIKEDHRLKEDLGMGELVKKAMATPYTKISKQYPEGKRVSIREAGALNTVGESIDLVCKKANGDKPC